MLFLAVAGLRSARLCLRVDLCADDYFYGTFLQDGFDHFLAQNIEHYQTFNGRVQVHLVLQVVLRLGAARLRSGLRGHAAPPAPAGPGGRPGWSGTPA